MVNLQNISSLKLMKMTKIKQLFSLFAFINIPLLIILISFVKSKLQIKLNFAAFKFFEFDALKANCRLIFYRLS